MRHFKEGLPSTLTEPTTLYNLAFAATKAITFDDGLDKIADLANLAYPNINSHLINNSFRTTARLGVTKT